MSSNGSNILYDLVRSLTWSERKTFADDIAKSHNAKNSDEDPIYMRLVRYLSKLERYDDEAVKEYFGYDESTDGAWRGLKRDTIERLERAILNAKGNATPRLTLQTIPNLITLLTQRGIWSRAETHCRRMIKVAEELQEFERLAQLIRLLQHIVVHTRPVKVAESEYGALRKSIIEVERKLAIEREYRTLWDQITFEARKAPLGEKETAAAILEHELLSSGPPDTVMAEHYYWRIRQRAFYLLENREGYLSSLEKSIAHSRKHLDRYQFFETFIQAVSDRVQIHLLAHEFDTADRKMKELERTIKKEEWVGYMLAQAEFQLHLNSISEAWIKVNGEEIVTIVKNFENWFAPHAQWIDPELQLKILKLAAVSLFVGKDLSGSARITYGIRTKTPAPSMPQATAFAWVFYLIVRLEQNEFEIIGRELNATRKFYEKHRLGNDLYLALVDAIGAAAKKQVGTDSPEFREKILPLSELIEQPAFDYFEIFFPFRIWLNSILNQVPFPELLKKDSEPYQIFQN